jgi:hypothetical protein
VRTRGWIACPKVESSRGSIYCSKLIADLIAIETKDRTLHPRGDKNSMLGYKALSNQKEGEGD